ncbi:MAG: NAD-dependent epimerase/dehydratase family protein, partial [Kofleriaceae bacterium]
MAGKQIAVVTGGAGFIGSHLVDRLVELGHRVIVLDNFATGKRANLERWLAPKHGFAGSDPAVEIVHCDVSHGIFAALAPITEKYGRVERIAHLAAQVSVVTSVANPLFDMQVNYGGTLHVLEYARAMGVGKVAFASSAAVYGDVDTMPVGEDTPTRPVSPYGIDKLASEHALAYYTTVHGIGSTALRFFNVYG